MRLSEKRIRPVAAGLAIMSVFIIGFFVALAVRSVVAGPSASPDPPNPGHAWSGIEGHGVDGVTGDYWLGTTVDQALDLRVNGARALRLEPNATSPNVIGGYSGNSATSGVYGATVGGGGESGNINEVTANHATVGGGVGNTAGGAASTVGGGEGNTASGWDSTVSGGASNAASNMRATVGGGINNTAGGDFATVGGGAANSASSRATVGGGEGNGASASWATIAGGYDNEAGGGYSAIGGGQGNTASADHNTVGGGYSNTASGYTAATVSGGSDNMASGGASAVSGGASNTASANYATVSGGYSNTAGGYSATVPGGYGNSAGGDYSFAAGRRAKADFNGCFVWGDSTDADVPCVRNDQFRVRANGGARFEVNSGGWVEIIYKGGSDLIATSTGAHLTVGGVWTDSSDADQKENFSPVEGQEVLASLADIPIATWNSKAQDASIRHMGPVAQDFYAAFGLGEDDLHIASLDTSGVALAAIQGLYEIVQEQDAHIQALEARVAPLEGGAPLERGSESVLSSVMPFGPLLLGALFVGGLVMVQRRRAGGQS
jgi:hypothetical protein